MTSLILDSSIVTKWFLTEYQSDIALKIKEDFVNGKIAISAPTLIFYEVANTLKTAVKSLRIGKSKAITAFEGFLDLGIIVYSSKDLLKNALNEAMRLDISSYDASYVVLAQFLQIPLFTADHKLQQKAKSPLVKKLTDYQIN